MEVYVNKQPFTATTESTLFDFLQSQDMAEKKGIAVAVNDAVVSRFDWESYILNNQDRITIIRAIQGG